MPIQLCNFYHFLTSFRNQHYFIFFVQFHLPVFVFWFLQIDFPSSCFILWIMPTENDTLFFLLASFFVFLFFFVSSRAVSIIELKKFITFYFWIMINLCQYRVHFRKFLKTVFLPISCTASFITKKNVCV